MKDNRLKGIIALAVVTVLAFGAVYGSKALTNNKSNNGTNGDVETPVEGGIDVSGFEGITAARETDDGYAVTAQAKGFAGNVTLEVSFTEDGKTINGVTVVSHSETPGYGANMENDDYLAQFNGITAPVWLPGNAPAATETEETVEETTETTEETADVELKDGTYTAETEYADNGFKDVVTVTIANGAITEVTWDAVKEDGSKKSVMSANGEYVMTDDGPTWDEQAKAVAAFVVENQNTEAIDLDEAGKTDSVAGVSISVNGFVSLVEQCLAQASGLLKDGVYTVEADAPSNGYLYSLTLKVENGAITSVVWDAANELGEYKSYLSSVGEYVMTDDGPTWKEQADALAAFVIENQSTEGISVDENGKTDSVASVSISVDGFVDLTEKALKLAASGEGSANEGETEEVDTEGTASAGAGTEIDAISGATVTSNAIVEVINNAYEFISAYIAQ
ncbi:MAG: FMN-binding protein [Clostridiales bacterium]|nr:FMN-binding protein [Clostridiales bacterium]